MRMNMEQHPTTVLIAEDNIPFRSLLVRMLEDYPLDVRVIDQVGNAEDVVNTVTHHQPGLVLLDLKLPLRGRMLTEKEFKHGLLALSCIRKHTPTPRVIIISNIGDNTHDYVIIERARELGIDGFLSKTDDLDGDMLLATIRAAMSGKEPICTPKIKPVLDGLQELAVRQREVFFRLAAGMANPEISTELGISVETVKSHVKVVLAKLHVQARDELVVQHEDREVLTMSFDNACMHLRR